MKIAELKLTEIKPYEKNPRKNDKSVDKVANSIKEFGFKVPVVIDKDNIIVCGHTRYKAAKKLGLQTVPCVIADDLTEEQIKAYRLADNKVGEDSAWDFDLLGEELDGIFDIDMTDFGFDLSLEEEIGVNDDMSEEELKKQFEERMANGENLEDNEEYQEFLKKFELKKTTDDCYTPDNIYNAVKEWVVKRYGLKGRTVIRPFYPGGDYQKENYPKNCVVIDNPPFSIMAEILKWYQEHNIDYFLFAPQLTIFSNNKKNNYVITNVAIIYENGAVVSTSFCTNLGGKKITVSAELHDILKKENSVNLRKLHKELPKYSFPDEVTTSARLGFMVNHGCNFEIDESDLYFIRGLDEQKEKGKTLYGGGFLLSASAAKLQIEQEAKAQEQKAQEQKAQEQWTLSDREKQIIKNLGNI